MLAITVSTNHCLPGMVGGDVIEPGLEGLSFAVVVLITDYRGAQGFHILKNCFKLWAAAVVDDDYCELYCRFAESMDQFKEHGIGFKSWNEDDHGCLPRDIENVRGAALLVLTQGVVHQGTVEIHG